MFFVNSMIQSVSLRSGFTTALLMLVITGCDSYEVVDFQADRCKQAPSGNLRSIDKGNQRWEFDVEGPSNTVETEPFRVSWIIEGKTYVARRVSYFFDQRGEQKVSVILTNRCFMQTVHETTINVK
jgi:hypothetical protein